MIRTRARILLGMLLALIGLCVGLRIGTPRGIDAAPAPAALEGSAPATSLEGASREPAEADMPGASRAAVATAAAFGQALLRGQVVGADGQSPVARARVLLFAQPLSLAFEKIELAPHERAPRVATTDGQGRFELTVDIPPGREMRGALWAVSEGRTSEQVPLLSLEAGQGLQLGRIALVAEGGAEQIVLRMLGEHDALARMGGR